MRDSSELDAFDRMHEQIQLLRVISSGALSILEENGPEIVSLLSDQRKLLSAFNDLSTAILLMWEIVMQKETDSHNLV